MKPRRQPIPAWLKGSIYQIYLRSFKDSNGDGIGDLNGVSESLEYLSGLGITALWLTPFQPSPLLDSGYDISNFTDVHPCFGTLADFDRLLTECHRRELRLILDFVGNHTSNQHPWFAEASSSRKNSYRHWYCWSDPAKDGGPPNNWLNEYGQSAWTWHEKTEQYYLHSFLPEQPDLNWRNLDVRSAMKEVLRFWLQRGVDGIRIDALPWMLKDEWLRSNPPNPEFKKNDPARQVFPTFTQDLPGLSEIIGELRRVVDEFPSRAVLGEIRLSIDRFPSYYEAGLHFPFNYQLTGRELSPFVLRKLIDSTEGLLGDHYWPNWLLGTHDESRAVTRYGAEAARLMAMLALTLRGTAVVYYGDELGMCDTLLPAAALQDSYERLLPGLGRGRDPQRTPMAWNTAAHAGFSKTTPWLPVGKDYMHCNAAVEHDDPNSYLNFYRRLLHLRQTDAFREGSYIPGEITSQGFSFRRIHARESFQICLNLSAETTKLSLEADSGITIVDTHDAGQKKMQKRIVLQPWQGIVVRLD